MSETQRQTDTTDKRHVSGRAAGAMPFEKYQAFTPIDLPDRQWPSRALTRAPRWCSVDLRDGNQALIDPMNVDEKLRLWDLLLEIGFAEIEVGFPAASQPDFDFIRRIIDEDRIPDGVSIQVLCQARAELIERTVEALEGAPSVIFHLYNSTSELQRRVVFDMDRSGIIDLAVQGTEIVKAGLANFASDVTFEYSPESFTGTELDFAVEISDAVMDVWQPTPQRKAILNLPATVEMATPNVYADQIEWFIRHVKNRESLIISLHPHNDRGTGVAATELAMMAGADRVEGTLFGNGERTGNVDVVNLALNLYSQGVDPGLEIADIDRIREVAEYCNQLPVHPRHPYAGDLVYTAFSGSHQDAIKKGMAAMRKSNSGLWEVPYLPIDPKDLGRDYEAIIRVNSQSGKGGVAYILHADHHLDLPRSLQIEFSRKVQDVTDATGKEISAEEIWRLFEQEYLQITAPYDFVEHWSVPDTHASELRRLTATIREGSRERTINGKGNGPIAAFVDALRADCGIDIRVLDYHEHAIGHGADATAVAYVEVADQDHESLFGVGMHPNITIASLRAVVCGVNRHLRRRRDG